LDKVIQIENFLTPEYCFEIIKKFDEYKHKIEDYRDNRKILSIDFIIPHDLLLKKVCYSITRAVQDAMNNPYLIPDYQQLVRWDIGSFCESHTDYPHQLSSSILYLNEEYEGGADKPINAFTNPGFQTTVYGGTPGSQAALSSGKRIMALNATAANSTSGLPSTANIRILGETTETQSASARGARLLISTTPNGGTSPQQTLILSEGNKLTVGNSTYQSGNATIEAGGGDLQLGSALDTNNKDIKNSAGNVKVNDNLDVTGNLNVDGSLTVDGAVTLGDANTDAITVNGPMTCVNGLILTSMNTATANYLAGVLGIIDEGAIAYITDGDGGNKCIAVYDGSNWKRISFGSNISSS